MKKIAILGSTGSIGTQTLEVIDWHPQLFQAELLCGNKNISLLYQQVDKYKPAYVVILDKLAGEIFNREYSLPSNCQLLIGMEGLLEAIELADFDIVVTAVSGAVGLQPTIAAINKGAQIALANKETLVAAGQLVMELAKEKNISILPVDSEHSAIFQCLKGETVKAVDKLVLTASGGPFRGYRKEELAGVTPKQALKHPKWNMGAKISIDSATLMNKGLEVIEAKWLFGVEGDQIEVVVHPQSIIHSMVQYQDKSIIAHLGPTDMKIPIQYALTYPERISAQTRQADLTEIATLTFEKPDHETFPALTLAYRALKTGGTMPVVLNAVNEEAVSLFLQNKLSFLEIPQLVNQVMDQHAITVAPSLAEIINADSQARVIARSYVEKGGVG